VLLLIGGALFGGKPDGIAESRETVKKRLLYAAHRVGTEIATG
jgi:hypothetical protein